MKNKKWVFIIIVLVVLALLSFLIAGILSLFISPDIETGSANVALIAIKGIIMVEKGSSFMGDVTSSSDIIELIEKANKNPSIKAILFEINSPGGSAVASEEIANKVKEINKTTVSWVREVGASGAYWVASASDYIIANRMSVTGSIGVIASYLQFAGFLSDHNVTYQRLVAGEYKDMGNPFKDLSLEEKDILQNKLDIIHDYFIKDIVKNRNLPEKKIKELSTGSFYLGSEAKDLGLVDELGGKEEAIGIIEKRLNITAKVVEYKKEKTFFEMLKEVFAQNSFFVGKGIGSALFDETKTIKGIDVWT